MKIVWIRNDDDDDDNYDDDDDDDNNYDDNDDYNHSDLVLGNSGNERPFWRLQEIGDVAERPSLRKENIGCFTKICLKTNKSLPIMALFTNFSLFEFQKLVILQKGFGAGWNISKERTSSMTAIDRACGFPLYCRGLRGGHPGVPGSLCALLRLIINPTNLSTIIQNILFTVGGVHLCQWWSFSKIVQEVILDF